jgi:hypothetical protein
MLLVATLVKVATNVALRLRPVPKRLALPRTVAPFLKVIVPVGPAPEVEVTVAVNVVGLPTATGFTLAVSAVLVESTLTTWLSAVEVLVLFNVSPAYTAVMLCDATDKADVAKVALSELPLPDKVPVPRVVLPSLNVTVPLGV